MPESPKDSVKWVRIPEPFGQHHEFGCCNAFVAGNFGGTACGWPRSQDGTCKNGHPAQPRGARLHSIGDLVAAQRVA